MNRIVLASVPLGFREKWVWRYLWNIGTGRCLAQVEAADRRQFAAED